MKHHPIFLIGGALLIAWSNNKAAQETTVTKTEQQPQIASNAETNQISGDGIVGYWKLTLEAYDDNGNKSLDEDERKKGLRTDILTALIPMAVARSRKVLKATMK